MVDSVHLEWWRMSLWLLFFDVPEMATCFEFFGASVFRLHGAYFNEVWSKLSIIEIGIWYFSTVDTILCKRVSSASFFVPLWISTLEIVAVLLTKCICRNKLWIHHRLSRSITSSSFFPLSFIRTLATDLETTTFTAPPFFLTDRRNFWTISSISPSKTDRPRFCAAIVFFGKPFFWLHL